MQVRSSDGSGQAVDPAAPDSYPHPGPLLLAAKQVHFDEELKRMRTCKPAVRKMFEVLGGLAFAV